MTLQLVVDNTKQELHTADILVEDKGSIVLLKGLNAAGQGWLDEHLDTRWPVGLGGRMVDARYVDMLIDDAVYDGLAVEQPAMLGLLHVGRRDFDGDGL